ncbi:cytochrome c oxidase assembly protein [Microbacterium halotolerans]|uniref:cytochrome c oxidase assembly protein n=1 Tax=Microbacterium halotolerans TaxID=246613 RepID=UPI000E6AC431|nr:cytochrome c oxidase assembly protein [Microbacterium halotolerans]
MTPPRLAEYLSIGPELLSALPLAAAVLCALYGWGVIRLMRQRRPWPIGRTAAFVAGCTVLAGATGLGVERYAGQILSVFMFQQLTLMMIVPPLLVLGSPGRLLLRATPHSGMPGVALRIALGALRSRWARWTLSPVVALPLYLLAFYGLYLADFLDPILAIPGGRLLLQTGFLVAGMLFTIPALTDDPVPARMGYGMRALDLFAEAALHAFFGVFMMMSPSLMVEHFSASTSALGMDPLSDQGLAGGLAWSYGEGPTLLMLLYIMHRWFRADTAAARAADRQADAHGDPELDAYNAHLAALQARAHPGRGPESLRNEDHGRN